MITPEISVMWAVEGVAVSNPPWTSCAAGMCADPDRTVAIQRFGTHPVGHPGR